jgi:hypothetical protein
MKLKAGGVKMAANSAETAPLISTPWGRFETVLFMGIFPSAYKMN